MPLFLLCPRCRLPVDRASKYNNREWDCFSHSHPLPAYCPRLFNFNCGGNQADSHSDSTPLVICSTIRDLVPPSDDPQFLHRGTWSRCIRIAYLSYGHALPLSQTCGNFSFRKMGLCRRSCCTRRNTIITLINHLINGDKNLPCP